SHLHPLSLHDALPIFRFAAIGLNHFHIYGQIDLMLKAGAEFVAYCGEEERFFDRPFAKYYPQAEKVEDISRIILGEGSVEEPLRSEEHTSELQSPYDL